MFNFNRFAMCRKLFHFVSLTNGSLFHLSFFLSCEMGDFSISKGERAFYTCVEITFFCLFFVAAVYCCLLLHIASQSLRSRLFRVCAPSHLPIRLDYIVYDSVMSSRVCI